MFSGASLLIRIALLYEDDVNARIIALVFMQRFQAGIFWSEHAVLTRETNELRHESNGQSVSSFINRRIISENIVLFS